MTVTTASVGSKMWISHLRAGRLPYWLTHGVRIGITAMMAIMTAGAPQPTGSARLPGPAGWAWPLHRVPSHLAGCGRQQGKLGTVNCFSADPYPTLYPVPRRSALRAHPVVRARLSSKLASPLEPKEYATLFQCRPYPILYPVPGRSAPRAHTVVRARLSSKLASPLEPKEYTTLFQCRPYPTLYPVPGRSAPRAHTVVRARLSSKLASPLESKEYTTLFQCRPYPTLYPVSGRSVPRAPPWCAPG